AFLVSSQLTVAAFRAAGVPDVPLAVGAVMDFTFGSIATAANHRFADGYYGRDGAALHARALEVVGPAADPDLVGVIEHRFVEADDERFEQGLRALLRGLLAGATDPPGTHPPAAGSEGPAGEGPLRRG